MHITEAGLERANAVESKQADPQGSAEEHGLGHTA